MCARSPGAAGWACAWASASWRKHLVPATGAGWDSGALGPGESFTVLAGTAGVFPYHDEVAWLNRGRILVDPNALLIPVLATLPTQS